MKKALIAIIATIYVIALVIVSFLGIKAEVPSEFTYIDEIVLNNEDLYRPNAEKIPENRIVHVYKRPDASQIDERGVGITDRVNWDFNGVHRDYAIYIEDYFYYYEMISNTYTIKTSAKPENASDKKLKFTLSATGKVQEYLTMSEYTDSCEITFLEASKTTRGWFDADIKVKAQDMSEVEIVILLKVTGYN